MDKDSNDENKANDSSDGEFVLDINSTPNKNKPLEKINEKDEENYATNTKIEMKELKVKFKDEPKEFTPKIKSKNRKNRKLIKNIKFKEKKK